MAYTLTLKTFNSDFSSSSSIDFKLLTQVVEQRENLKLETEGDTTTLQIRKESESDWFPLLWISDGYAYINAAPIFEFHLYYDLVDIAESINACIITEDGMFFFIPQYGLIYDPEENDDTQIEIGVLKQEIEKTENLAVAVKHIVSKKRSDELDRQKESGKKQTKIDKQYQLIAKIESKQHYIAIVVVVILIVLMTIKKLNK